MSRVFCSGRSQASLEYIIVIGVALAILTGLVVYSYYYSTAYSFSRIGQGLTLIANSVRSTVSYLSAQQQGSTFNFAFNSPGLDSTNSYFCGDYVVLSSQGQEAAQIMSLPVVGEIPLGTGNFQGQGVLAEQGGNTIVEMKFNLPIAFINTSYSLSAPYLNYNISFQSFSGALVQDVNFSVLVYTPANTLLASQSALFTSSGSYNGRINISHNYPDLKVIVSVPSMEVASALCYIPGHTLPLSIANTQYSPTSTPFQQEVIMNSSAYSEYENPSLNNVQFAYTNGTIIPSWLESGNLATFAGPGTAYINTSNSNLFNIGSAFTVVGWARISSTSGTFDQILVDKGSSTHPNQGYELFYGWGTDVYFGVGNSTGFYYAGPVSNLATAAGNWVQLVGVYDNGQVSLYVNGVLSASISVAGSTINTKSLYIGGLPNYHGLKGSVAGIQIYGSALTTSEIAQLYSNGIGSTPITGQDLLGWWPLADNTNDYSGNGNNGIATNVIYSATGSGSTATVYWLKLGQIPADSKLTSVNMNFYPTGYSVFNNKNTGEAPILSQAYGQYDDGAKVFNYYWNFSGTVLPTVFSEINPSTVSINNGINVSIPSGTKQGGIESNFAITSGMVYEAGITALYSKYYNYTYPGAVGLSVGNYANWNGYLFVFNASNIGWAVESNVSLKSGVGYHSLFLGTFPHTGTMEEAWPATGSEQYGYNGVYSTVSDSTYASGSTQRFAFGAFTASPNSYISAQWIRVRAYPPEGTMPSVTFGTLS